jgi:predicted ATPase
MPGEAELHRLRGEALLAGAGTINEAEAAMQQAIHVARPQNVKSWELRGAMKLARLRLQQGRQQEAVSLLAPVLGWFTEGFDTADLQAPARCSTNSKTPSPSRPPRYGYERQLN